MSMEMSNKKARRKNADRAVLLLVSLVLVLSVAIGGTLGYLTGQVSVTNTMDVGDFTTEIEEKLDGKVKHDVQVSNTGEYDAYVRAIIVVTWQNESGNVYPEAPVPNQDYTIEYGSGWTQNGQFWYYNGVVDAGSSTSNLIQKCEPIESAEKPEGYDLNVEILASSIQTDPANAVQDAWGMQFNTDSGWTSASQVQS